GVVVHLLESQGNTLALLIDGDDHARDLVALGDNLGRVRDLADPAHVGDVQEAVDAFLDLDESAVVGQVANDAGDNGVGWVAFGDLVPGVGLDLLHAQRDFLFLLVDVQDLDLDLVAYLHQFVGVVDPFGPGHLRDMHQALDAWLQLDEGTVAHHV